MKIFKSIVILMVLVAVIIGSVAIFRTPSVSANAAEADTTQTQQRYEPVIIEIPPAVSEEVPVVEAEEAPAVVEYEASNDFVTYQAVAISDLNLRNDFGDYITTVPGNAIVTVTGRFNDERVYVEYDLYHGHVLEDHLLPTENGAICICALNLRDADDEVLELLQQATVVITTGESAPEGRTAVRYSNLKGHVLTESLQDSFVLIDRRSQFVALYKGGSLVISGPCVTGCVATNRETPAGVFYLMDKVVDTWLTGKDWSAHVTYWMPFCAEGRIGMHDADEWRTEYGGEIYQYSGSHGCVNEPFALAETIFNEVWVGFPIVVR